MKNVENQNSVNQGDYKAAGTSCLTM